jgi:hypothetical protein
MDLDAPGSLTYVTSQRARERVQGTGGGVVIWISRENHRYSPQVVGSGGDCLDRRETEKSETVWIRGSGLGIFPDALRTPGSGGDCLDRRKWSV